MTSNRSTEPRPTKLKMLRFSLLALCMYAASVLMIAGLAVTFLLASKPRTRFLAAWLLWVWDGIGHALRLTMNLPSSLAGKKRARRFAIAHKLSWQLRSEKNFKTILETRCLDDELEICLRVIRRGPARTEDKWLKKRVPHETMCRIFLSKDAAIASSGFAAASLYVAMSDDLEEQESALSLIHI